MTFFYSEEVMSNPSLLCFEFSKASQKLQCRNLQKAILLGRNSDQEGKFGGLFEVNKGCQH
ncbi:hypothetical protein CsatA_004716 [Cannabis sativa]